MATAASEKLAELYEQDETAWLEAHSALIRAGRLDEIDSANLAEYLSDMARRDKREVASRLVVLIAHFLKWDHQPEGRSKSWRRTILLQRRELEGLLESGVLRLHAVESLAKAHARAIREAAVETGLPASIFPSTCLYSLDELLEGPLAGWDD